MRHPLNKMDSTQDFNRIMVNILYLQAHKMALIKLKACMSIILETIQESQVPMETTLTMVLTELMTYITSEIHPLTQVGIKFKA